MRRFIFALNLFMAPVLIAATDSSAALQEYEQSNFLQSLQSEIQKQQDLVNSLNNQLERTDIVAPDAVNTNFENAYIMLNVKKTLYANFVGTPSIKSPLVQAKLLQIFRKEIITPSDLSELEALVKQERPKYVKPAAPASTKPSSSPTPAIPPTPTTPPTAPVAQ